ncbi:ribonuclease P protein subunit p40 [Osmerus eperlanus]|uniref:ribonuclease P protein subunit p40 n=1 Tax=Osmerus eperlanus TaxID=29151 RepID=UPI002E107FEE
MSSAELQKCPRTLLVCEKSNFEDENSRYHTHVSHHFFNHKVSLFLPDCGGLTSRLTSVFNGFNKFYLLKDLPVYKLLEKEFLDNVLHKGGVYALSYKTRIDEDNTIALLPNRQLILSLDKDTYEQLGLEGKPSRYNHRRVMRYVVTINLTEKAMAPGGKFHKKVLTSLQERVTLKSDFLLSQHSSGVDGNETLQSFLSHCQWTEHRPHVNTLTLRDLPCPALHHSDLRGDQSSCDPTNFLEWLGAVNADIDCDNTATSFLSTYACPEPHIPVSRALLCTITGLLLPEDIYKLLQELRSYFDEPKFTSWLSLTVHGFMDSPVSWGFKEHSFHKGGENFYNFVIFKNQDYWLHMGAGAHDECPP